MPRVKRQTHKSDMTQNSAISAKSELLHMANYHASGIQPVKPQLYGVCYIPGMWHKDRVRGCVYARTYISPPGRDS